MSTGRNRLQFCYQANFQTDCIEVKMAKRCTPNEILCPSQPLRIFFKLKLCCVKY